MICLNLGCGPKETQTVHPLFKKYDVIRVDLNPDVEPDYIADVRDLSQFDDNYADGIYCWHVIEHLYPHEIVSTLKGFVRVLKPGGIAIIGTPDLHVAAYQIVMGNVDKPVYESQAGPIYAVDMLYGFRPEIANGNLYMAHKTGFTSVTLSDALKQAGFAKAKVHAENYGLLAMAEKERNERNDYAQRAGRTA